MTVKIKIYSDYVCPPALENRTYQEEHQKALQHAYNEADITAVPTFVIGDTVAESK